MTATYIEENCDENDVLSYSSSTVYNYSYNADENLLYLSFQSASGTDDGEEWSYASLEDVKKVCEEDGYSSVATEMELEWEEQDFSTLEIKKYTIDGNTLKLENYFDGSFSGTAYDFNDEMTAVKLGTISGTYTTSGSGTAESGCTVTLNFTSIPSGIPVIVTGKDYVLEMSGRFEDTYTLVSE
ncbi:MAG: hypothetical protein K6B43_04810 [Treponema sp.]|nr:hypothetical protein [Treponema sp.]